MNFKRLFVALMAACLAFTACEQDEDLGIARILSNPAELSFAEGDGSDVIHLTASRDWMVSSYPEWVALSKVEGKAAVAPQDITVSVNANPGYNRTGSIVFTIGLAEKQTVTIAQAGAQGEVKMGSGTVGDPFTVPGVIQYVTDLGADVTSSKEVFIKGKISKIASSGTYTDGGTYGNATFYISEDGSETGSQFYCYRILYLGNRKFKSGDTDIKVGDDAIICGKVVNYKGNTPETSQNSAFLYSLNGKNEGGEPDPGPTPGTAKGSGTLADPYNPAGAAAFAASLGSDVQSPEPVYIKGKISKVGTSYAASGTYGNASFNIVDVADGTGDFYVFQTYYLGNRQWKTGDTDVKVGDEVIVCGPVINFKGNTPETVGKGASYVYSLNGVTDGGNPGTDPNPSTPRGTGTLEDPYNAAAANAFASSLESGAKSDSVYVAGRISSIKYTFSAQYGTATFNISDDGATSGSQFTCYSVYYLGNHPWVEGDTQIAVGDDVIIRGKLTNYQGNTPETSSKEAYIFSLTSNGTGPGPGPGPGPGDSVVIDFTAQGYANASDFSSLTVNGVTVTGSMGSNTKNGPKYYNTGTAVRFYSGNTFTVSAGKEIKGIVLEYGSGDGTNDITATPGTFSSPNWSGSAASVTFSVGGTTGHRRIAKISVSF